MSAITDLLQQYRHGAPNQLIEGKITRELERYEEKELEKIIDWILYHPPKFSLGLDHIRVAISESGAIAPPEYVQAERIRCDACGWSYQWTQCSCREWKETKNIHDRCPNCGLDYIDTVTAEKIAESNHGKIPAWYEKIRKRCLGEHPAGSAPHYDAAKDKADDERKKLERLESMKVDAGEEVRKLTAEKSIDVEAENRERLAKRRAEADAAARDLFGV
jgi:predicted  nucleic acid-binding Zn-ribbon protein